MTASAAPVKDAHWFIRTAQLYLNKKGFLVTATRTHRGCSLPKRLVASQEVFHGVGFFGGKRSFQAASANGLRVGTSAAKKLTLAFLYQQECAVDGAKPHCFFIRLPLCLFCLVIYWNCSFVRF